MSHSSSAAVGTTSSPIGTVFPSEKKTVTDPETGKSLIFLTSGKNKGDSKIYPTHTQWTSDGQWIIFRSERVPGEAMAVHEKSGSLVQVTEGGYLGMLLVSRKEMKLFHLFPADGNFESDALKYQEIHIIEVNLGLLFNDITHSDVQDISHYSTVAGTIPAGILGHGDCALDADEHRIYFRESADESAKYIDPNMKIEDNFGPRKMGKGPSGIGCYDIRTGTAQHLLSAPFQIGHIQTNPWVTGEVVFCWETGGKAPQRTWIADGYTGEYRELYQEAEFEWVTHEIIFSKEEVGFAIMGHRSIPGSQQERDEDVPGNESDWGDCGTRKKPTGLAILNTRTGEMNIAAQTDCGSGLWHVAGSSDGKWAVGDDFDGNIYLIDRQSKEIKRLSSGHKPSIDDHPHPTFSPDNTRIQIQSSFFADKKGSMNICIIPID